MTKKDFERIAEILGTFNARPPMVDHFVAWFQEANPRFDEGRFLRAVSAAWDAERNSQDHNPSIPAKFIP